MIGQRVGCIGMWGDCWNPCLSKSGNEPSKKVLVKELRIDMNIIDLKSIDGLFKTRRNTQGRSTPATMVSASIYCWEDLLWRPVGDLSSPGITTEQLYENVPSRDDDTTLVHHT